VAGPRGLRRQHHAVSIKNQPPPLGVRTSN